MNEEEQIRYKKAQQRIMSPQEVEQRRKFLENRERTKSTKSNNQNQGKNKKREVGKKNKTSKNKRSQTVVLTSEEQRRLARVKRKNSPTMVDYLNKICMFLIIIMFTHLIFITQTIAVVKNELIEDVEILDWIAEDPFTVNAIYTWAKYNFFVPEMPVQVEGIGVKFKKPWSLEVSVQDKTLVGGALVDEEFVYYDKDGVVLLISTTQVEEILFFEGFVVENAQLYEKIPVGDIEIFGKMVELSMLLENEGLILDELSHEGMNVSAKLGGVKILFGSENYKLKIQQLEPILAELEGKEGILDLKNYKTSNDMITFK